MSTRTTTPDAAATEALARELTDEWPIVFGEPSSRGLWFSFMHKAGIGDEDPVEPLLQALLAHLDRMLAEQHALAATGCMPSDITRLQVRQGMRDERCQYTDLGRAMIRRAKEQRHDRAAIEELARGYTDEQWTDILWWASHNFAGACPHAGDNGRALLAHLDDVWKQLDDYEHAYLRVSQRIGAMSYFHRSLEDGGLSTGSPNSGWTLTPRARAVLKRHQDKEA